MMKSVLAVLASVCAAWDKHPVDLFADFMKTHEKKYKDEEKDHRFKIFLGNLEFIEKENAKGHTYTLGITKFADLTAEEFGKLYLSGVKPSLEGVEILKKHKYSGAKLEDSVDWSEKGAVTPIKDQGQCGSCWAFSSTGALEGAFQIATGELVSMSEQQFVDCAKSRYGNFGCNGGMYSNVFNYLKNHTQCTEEAYPYQAVAGQCNYDTCNQGDHEAFGSGVVSGFVEVEEDEESLMEAVQRQPVSVAIEADQAVFQLYKDGVLTDEGCGHDLDHAVLAVGFGTLNDVKYWKVKNSWGPSWGQEGYILLGRGMDECGILNGPAMYPELKTEKLDKSKEIIA